ncbi:MAG: hypothetical protein A3F74_00015 [Betaproteobacteria bacterium RIFCSPLOWO2_12_FULL_62_58]|nr:MAG: hypothetical protein A3F74_00015 [Betaproteobacteria bacterium RIFCSPLOWO2_12_FULL_62_58]
MKEINPSAAFFVKLGSGGHWEADCLQKDHTLRLGFDETDHAACMRGDWQKIRNDLLGEGRAKGKATEIANEIRYFYEADENTLWVTFFGNRMWWAFARREVTRLPDGSKTRSVIAKWRSTDLQGNSLSLEKISGRFLQVRRFQGTICSVDLEYAKNKINGKKPAVVGEAEAAMRDLETRLVPLIRALSWKDFELLVDLIFSNAGWQRISVLGKTEKTLDIDLRAPVTGERVMVQVKSASDKQEYSRYHEEFLQAKDFSRLFYVVHSPSPDLADVPALPNSTIIYAPSLAQMVVNAGLSRWLIEKNT